MDLTFLRWFFAISGAACLALWLLPGAQGPFFASTLAFARNPAAALRALRIALIVMAAALGVVSVVLPSLARAAAAAADRVAGMSRRRYLVLLVVVAFGLRAVAVAIFIPSNVADGAWYHQTASSLAAGSGFAIYGQLTAYRPPGYPWLLSLFYRVAGPHAEIASIPGLLASGLLLGATFCIGRMLYGERVARLACLALSAYPALVLSTALAASDLPFSAGLTALLAFHIGAERGRFTTALVVGVGLGLLALVRTSGVAFWGVFLLIACVKARSWRKGMTDGLLMGALMMMPLAGWTLRNARLFGEPTLVTNGGVNLLIGNHAGASGGFDPDFGVTLSELGGLNEAQLDRDLRGRAFAFVRQHPIEAARLLPKKVFRLFGFELDAAQAFFTTTRAPSWVKYGSYGLSQAAYLVLLALFLARCVAILRAGANQRPVGLQWTGFWVGGAVLVVTLATFGHDRYRLPFLPWMMIEAVRAADRGPLTTAGVA